MEGLHIIVLFIECLIVSMVIVYLHASVMSLARGAPFVPTRDSVIDKVLEQVSLSSATRFLELGCGDGRVVCRAVSRYGVQGMGVDVSLLWILLARLRAWRMSIGSRVSFHHQDILRTDLSQADVIYLYMMPRFLRRYSELIVAGSSPHTIIISHRFELSSEATSHCREIGRVETSKEIATYFYEVR